LGFHAIRESAQKQTISIYTGTWNIGGAAPPSLDSWIPTASNNYDLIVVAVQECKWKKVDSDIQTPSDWSAIIQAHVVNTNENYELVAEVLMWEIGLLVMAHKKHRNVITNIETDTKPTGFANLVGNKGGVGISFRFYDTSLCFVNSHLPARAVRVMNRNQDYSGLVDGLGLGLKRVDLLNQFHYLFWLGDLNYRIDLPKEKILQLLELQYWDSLFQNDQLTKEKMVDRTFCDFSEGRITFFPTYRYERGSNEWSKKKLQNVPSYCDRILWRTLPEMSVQQHEYKMVDGITTSDHRPVYSSFSIDVSVTYEDIFDQVFYPVQIILYDLEITRVNDANFPQKKILQDFVGSLKKEKQVQMEQKEYLTVRAPFLEGQLKQFQLEKMKTIDGEANLELTLLDHFIP